MLEPLRRHPVLTALALLLATGGGALTLFLYSFNLNDYRSQLQGRLETALQRPVRIGSIHFALRHGLSLDLDTAAIGAPGEETFLRVDHLLLRLRLAPLLQRQLSFSSVLFDGAELQLNTRAGENPIVSPESLPGKMNRLIDLLRRTDISSLTFSRSKVVISSGEERCQLDNLNLQLRNIAFSAPIAVMASGEVTARGVRAPWELRGEILAASAEAPWSATRFDLDLKVKGVKLAALSLPNETPEKKSWSGILDLTMSSRGAPASGLAFNVHALGKDLSLALPALYRTPLRGEEGELSGIWQNGAPGKISDLRLRLDHLALRGDLLLPAGEKPLSATLSIPETPLTRLGPWIPDRPLPALAAALRSPEVGGTISSDRIALSWSQPSGVNLAAARWQLRQGRFPLEKIGLVEKLQADGEWAGGALTITGVKGDLLGGRSSGAGKIDFPKSGEPRFNLEIASTAKAEALRLLLPAIWQEKLTTSGPLTVSGKIAGTRSRLLVDLQSRFDGADLTFNHILLKRAGESGELLLLGEATAAGLELSHSRLLLPFAEARANGRLALDASGGYTLACDISNLRIEKLPPFLEIQKELRGRGIVDLRLDLSGDQGGLKSLQGSGDFRQLGIHLWNAVADLEDGSGRMLLSREGITFPELSGRLGTSPLHLSADLLWLPEFKLILDLDLSRTRASDLVFSSPKKTFSAISGRLVISASEILFEKIAAQIADETAVLVNGRLTYAPARVVLDIAASQANIAGIIALWQDGARKEVPATPPPAHPAPLGVEITARIAQGDLYGVAFSRASATIALRDGTLIIQPLRLTIGSGSAALAIATGPLHQDHPLFKISGEAEKIDAAQVQKQLLGRQGSITGTLDSTFSLQGELGRFLPTCNGNVKLRLDQGLLRGFTSVSRALALFNVGKILTFNLPDVANNGLLFDRIKGNLTFSDGVLASDDLAVASAAFDMAFVGKADLAQDRLDFLIGVKPLQTIDKVLSSIPLAGWILTGEKKAFVIANFHVTGSSQDPRVEAVPFSSLSAMAVGIFKRTFGLPAKIVNDVKELFQ